ncbi:MAG TPA: P-type conjugative transfer protein TrbL [Steroidobacteraceae bacterium]
MNIRPTHLWLLCGAALLAMLFLAHPASAATSQSIGGQIANFSLFDRIDSDAQIKAGQWQTTIQALVVNTFRILAVIEICWAAAIWAFEKDSLNSLAVEVIKKIMFISFFYMLLTYAPFSIRLIPDTFRSLGQQATQSGPISTDSIVADGLAFIKFVWARAPHGFFSVLAHLGQILVACFVSLGILIAYVIIAAQYFTLQVESYILFAAGAVFLGLGSSSWTKEYVSKYLNYAINVGIRLLVLILVLDLTIGVVNDVLQGFSFDFVPLLTVLAFAVLQVIMAIKAPEMAGALLSGGGGLTAGGAAGASSSALGGLRTAVGTAAGAAMGSLRTAVSAGQGASNLKKAVQAGNALADQQGKTGALAGLGLAASAVAQQMPRRMMNAIKGKAGSYGLDPSAGGGMGQMNGNPTGPAAGSDIAGRGLQRNPGVFDVARQNLKQQHPGRGSDPSSSESTSRPSSDGGAGADDSTSTSDGSPSESASRSEAPTLRKASVPPRS